MCFLAVTSSLDLVQEHDDLSYFILSVKFAAMSVVHQSDSPNPINNIDHVLFALCSRSQAQHLRLKVYCPTSVDETAAFPLWTG